MQSKVQFPQTVFLTDTEKQSQKTEEHENTLLTPTM